MKKRFIRTLAVFLVCLVALMPFASLKSEAATGDTTFYYKIEGDTIRFDKKPFLDILWTKVDSRGTGSVKCPWEGDADHITTAKFENVITPDNCSNWFVGMSKLTTIEGINFLDTSGCTNMDGMFSGCSSLTSLDLSYFSTANVTSMYWMFVNCSSLTSLNLSNFNTAKVTNMYNMFGGCTNLKTLNISGFNTSSVTDMSWMFNGCSSLTFVDVSNFDTSKVVFMNNMFQKCSSLTSLDVSGFNTSNVTNMAYMFSRCSSLTSLDVSGFNTAQVTTMYGMFAYCKSVTVLDIADFDLSSCLDISWMFEYCQNITELDVSRWDTSTVTLMFGVFAKCKKLPYIDVTGFDTSNVTHMGDMFQTCTSLASVDVTNFDTSKVTDMAYMFYKCTSLPEVDVSKFDTSNVVTMERMFAYCSSFTDLDVSNFNCPKVTDMSHMFAFCSSLETLNVGVSNTSSLVLMPSMFTGCSRLKNLDLSNFNTSKVTDMAFLFYNCTSLEHVDMSSFDTSAVTSREKVFFNTNSIKDIITQEKGVGNIALPFYMIEKDNYDSPVYLVMPSGSITIVPYAASIISNATDTTICFNKLVDSSNTNIDVFSFGIYKEDGTKVSEVQNDVYGNILIETKDFEVGRYYVQEIAGTATGVIYDNSKIYFTISEEVVDIENVLTIANTACATIDPSYLTDYDLIANELNVTAFDRTTGEAVRTFKGYSAKKEMPFPKEKKCGAVYVNPTLAEFNEVRGEVYDGAQQNILDAIKCILYFNDYPDKQVSMFKVLYSGETVDTSKVNEIPDSFQWAIITPPEEQYPPIIVVLYQEVGHELSEEEITTGQVTTKSHKVESKDVTFKNTTDALKTVSINKVDASGAALSGAKLAVKDEAGNILDTWVSNGQPHSFSGIEGSYVLCELSAPSGYNTASDIPFSLFYEEASPDEYVISSVMGAVSGNAITIVNSKTEGSVVNINKYDSLGNRIIGASFQLKDESGTVIKSFSSENNAVSLTVPNGTYTLTETQAPAGFLSHPPITITVNNGIITADGTALVGGVLNIIDEFSNVVYVENEVIGNDNDRSYDFVAYIESPSEEGIKNITIYDSQNNVVTEFDDITVTTENSHLIYHFSLKDGEKAKIEGFVGNCVVFEASDEAYETSVSHDASAQALDASGSTIPENIATLLDYMDDSSGYEHGVLIPSGTVVFNNSVNTLVTVKKVSNYLFRVKGASLQILDSGNSVVSSWTTGDEDHSVLLPAGTYTLRETDAPDGFEVAEDIVFTVTSAGQVSIDGNIVPDNTIKMVDKFNIAASGIALNILPFFLLSAFGFGILVVKKRKK